MKSATDVVDRRCWATGLGSRGGNAEGTYLSPTKLTSEGSLLWPNLGRLLLRGLKNPKARDLNAITGTLDARVRAVLLYTLEELSSIPRSRFGVGRRGTFEFSASTDPSRFANSPPNF
jgi:hypothetical protein